MAFENQHVFEKFGGSLYVSNNFDYSNGHWHFGNENADSKVTSLNIGDKYISLSIEDTEELIGALTDILATHRAHPKPKEPKVVPTGYAAAVLVHTGNEYSDNTQTLLVHGRGDNAGWTTPFGPSAGTAFDTRDIKELAEADDNYRIVHEGSAE